ncbi:MAG: GtrA family protein [Alkalibacterium sp.]
MLKKLYVRFEQFIDYFLFGLVTAGIGILTFYLLNGILNWHYLIANAIAVTCAILFSYIVNKRYVFKSHTKTRKAFFREFGLFVSLRATAAALDMLGLILLVRFFSFDPTWSKIGVEVIIASSNYLISRGIIFKDRTHKKG